MWDVNAKSFEVFGCRIIEVHRDLKNLDFALTNADIVVVTLALTEATRGRIKPTRMKPGSVLVNISRGAVIDRENLFTAFATPVQNSLAATASLATAFSSPVSQLQGSHLLGAVLDVFDEEPLLPENPLWDMPNVILTPHNSFVGNGNTERLWQVIRDNLNADNAPS